MDNLILFPDTMADDAKLELIRSETIDWLTWAKENGLLA